MRRWRPPWPWPRARRWRRQRPRRTLISQINNVSNSITAAGRPTPALRTIRPEDAQPRRHRSHLFHRSRQLWGAVVDRELHHEPILEWLTGDRAAFDLREIH